MFRHEPPAHRRPLTVPVRGHDGDRRTLPGGLPNQFAGTPLVERCRQDAEVARFGCRVDREWTVFAVRREVLQLKRPVPGGTAAQKGVVERRLAAEQPVLHEDLPHDPVDEGRVDPVAAEIAGPREACREHREAVEAAFDRTGVEFHRLLFQKSGQTARREGDLEVVAARVGIEVEHLACKVEPPHLERLHRIGVHLVAADAARRGHGVFEGGVVRNGESQSLEGPDKAVDLRLGEFREVEFRVDVQFVGQRQHELFRNEAAQQFAEELRGAHVGDFAGDAVVQRLGIEGRFEVQHQLDRSSVDEGVDAVAAEAQRHGPLDAAFREADLAELFADLLSVDRERRADVAQQQPVHVGQLGMGRANGRERGAQRFDRVTEVGGEGVAVARRTGPRVADATRCEDHARALFLALEAPLVAVAKAEDAVADREELRHAGFVADLHAVPDAVVEQRIGDVPRLAAVRKDAFAAFDVEFDALALEEADRRPVVELSESLRQKFAVRAHVFQKLFGRAGVRDVAASFARDAHLAARFLHLFEKQHALSAAGCRAGGHQARRSGSHDDHVERLPFGCWVQFFHNWKQRYE